MFAQTDVRPLLNAGASKADIAASVFDAVVRQTLSGLACGRPIRGNVVFLGGPLEHMPYLVHAFRRTLGLSARYGVKPKNAHLFTCLLYTSFLFLLIDDASIDHVFDDDVLLFHLYLRYLRPDLSRIALWVEFAAQHADARREQV